MNAGRSIAVLGYGMLTPLARTAEDTWIRLMSGVSGCGKLTRFPSHSFPVRIAAQVPDEYWAPVRRQSLAYTFAEQAIDEALSSAGLSAAELGPETGLVIGIGGDDDGADSYLAFMDELATRAPPGTAYDDLGPVACCTHPTDSHAVNLETLASALAMHFGIEGEVMSVATACAAGAHAIAIASDMLLAGAAQRVIAVGSDAMLSRVNFANFCALGVLSQCNTFPEGACRPFDSRRQGFVMSEGAGAMVLCSSEDAQRSLRPPKGYIRGYGVSADAFSITDKEPSGEGAFLAIREALAHSHVSIHEVSYICAHGTGTRKNDIAEMTAIRRAFGAEAQRIPISSLKGQLGHSIASAGIIQAIAVLMALRERRAPGTSTLERVSSSMSDLNLLPRGSHTLTGGVGVSIAAGFGGVNVCLVLQDRQ